MKELTIYYKSQDLYVKVDSKGEILEVKDSKGTWIIMEDLELLELQNLITGSWSISKESYNGFDYFFAYKAGTYLGTYQTASDALNAIGV